MKMQNSNPLLKFKFTFNFPLIIMRRVSCFVFIMFFLIQWMIGQNVDAHKRSGSYENKPIEQVLRNIEDLYGVSIYYKDDDQLKRVVDLTFKDLTVDEVLDKLLEQTTLGHIDYRQYAKVVAPRFLLEQSYSSDYYNALESSLTESAQGKKVQVGDITNLNPDGLATIHGIVRDAQTNEGIIGATVLIEELKKGTTTDPMGRYELSGIPAGLHKLNIEFLGFNSYVENIEVLGDGQLNIRLDKAAVELDEVTIRARSADASVNEVQIGVESLDLKAIKKLPKFMGEVDVVKSFLLQPGVSTVGEGASGFNVRGGNVDQNLILQDEAILFNSSHALGFFSTFNADLIKSVDLYKANIPARFGGRLVSVMDVELKDGDFEKVYFKGSVGLITSKILAEGPIIKDKLSFIGGFRSSYTDWLLKRLSVPELQKSSSFFYDGNIKLTFKPSAKHNFSFSAYSSQDEFVYNEEFGFDYTTQFAQLDYKLLLSDEMINSISIVGSKYVSSQFDFKGLDGARIDNNISYLKFKDNLKIVPSDELEVNLGVEMINYFVDPGNRFPYGEISTISEVLIDQEKGRESAVFGDAIYNLSDGITLSAGMRLAAYQFLGPHDETQYEDPNLPTIGGISSVVTKTGTVASYTSIEPRVSMRFNIGSHSSVKAGYSRTSQFISQIFNTDSPTPTSQWQLSTRYISPFRSHNASIGVFKNSDDNVWETSIEVYARKIDELFDYVDFARLLVNDNLETELRKGEGRAYGAELSIKKNSGKVNGWFSYTYARSERRVDEINSGEWYLSNFDKTHDASLILNYQPNQRNTLGLNISYSTGRPTTPPIGNFLTPSGLAVPIYSKRNAARIPDYFRVDLSYTVGKGYKKDKKFKTSWTFSIYNVLGRKNPFSVFFTRAAFEQVQANRLAILGSVFPSLTINFELL